MKWLALLLLLVPSSAYAQSISFGNVTTAAPAYLTGTNRPFSLDLNGNLRTIGALPTGAATSANQTNAGQKTQIVDGSGNVIASTSNNLNVQCANCSGSGVSAADEAVFTAGTTLFAAGGGFFQTTATNNALTTGQQGAFQLTANRALFSNLRNAAGTEVGTASTPLQVSLANTAANGTAVSVSLAANQSVNVAQINGVTPLMGNGITGTGSQRVTIASDNTAFSVNAAQATAANLNATVVGTGTFVTQSTLAAETTKVIGTIRITGNIGGVLDAIGQNVAAPANWLQGGCQFNTSPTTITNGNGSPLQCDNGGKLLSTISGTVTANAGTNLNTSLLALEAGGNLATLAGTVTSAVLQANVKQINGVVPLMGNGITGTGSQRVTIASDNTAFSVNAAQSGAPWSENITQFGGVNISTSTGASGTGIPRVTVSNDSKILLWDGTNTDAVKAASTNAALTDPAAVVALSPNPSTVCTSFKAISQTTSTDLITSTNKLHICAMLIVSATAQSISLVEGTGSVCATGIAAVMGSTTAANGMALSANGGWTHSADRAFLVTATTADHFCLLQSGAGNVSGFISYIDHN